MCGRFTLHTEREVLARRFRVDLEDLKALEPRYNIAPSTNVLTVRTGEAGREARWMRWGLIPSWAKDRSKLASMINARVETVATRRAYRVPVRRQRCLIPADGFYEWGPSDLSRGQRTPFWVSLRTPEPFAMAGLWSRWQPPDAPDAEPELSCTILTAPARGSVRRIHDRMPVILRPECEEAWLDPDLQDVSTVHEVLEPVAPELLVAVPVSRAVNSPRNDGPELICPVPEPPTLGF